MDYEAFLASKQLTNPPSGLEIPLDAIHPALFSFQRALVQWCVRRGRAALWASTGLGKTRIALEWARLLAQRTLILAPLAVAQQTVREGQAIGVEVAYVRSQAEAEASSTAIVITNYEMLHHMDAAAYGAVVLDESSCLKAYSGKTKQALLRLFADTRYRLACTATPAPNDHMELGNHADFLGIMPSSEMLSRWFLNDTMHAGAYRLKAHAADDFWRWVSSWAVCCTLPSDLGAYDDTPYRLPPLRLHTHALQSPVAAYERGTLFHLDSVNATDLWKEKRATAAVRCAAVAALAQAQPTESWLLWCDTNDESTRLAALLPEAIEVRGDQSLATKEAGIHAFLTGAARILISKADILGFGLNLQHCHHVAFTGLTFSYEKFYQAIRRTWRFGQHHPVEVHLMSIDTEATVQAALDRKHADHCQMQDAMRAATRQHYHQQDTPLAYTTAPITTHEGPDWTLYEGDCIQALTAVPDNTVGFTITSPPFANLYIYSDALADMGNSTDMDEFCAHLNYLMPELYRVTMPGRLMALHCKDLPLYMNRDGAAGLLDFPAKLRECAERAGWIFHSRITIWKDPVTEMQRTKNHGLLHKNFAARREVCRQGMADYVLVFRAWKGEIPDKQIYTAPEPGIFIGENAPPSWRNERDYSIQVWQRYASPVWFDIRQQRVLPFFAAKGSEDEKHICPLQLDVIERCIWLWSNENDICLDPFGGIGSTAAVALQQNRRVILCELKTSYAQTAIKNINHALGEKKQQFLF